MNTAALVLIGYGIGLLISVLLFRPAKAYKDGYEAAEKPYKDWDDGYHTGWNAGWDAGWNSAFREMERKASAWNHRDERKEE